MLLLLLGYLCSAFVREDPPRIGYVQNAMLFGGGSIVTPPLLQKVSLNPDGNAKFVFIGRFIDAIAWMTVPERERREVEVQADPTV
jgi:hypothetical protein